jgi:hypothetical protein
MINWVMDRQKEVGLTRDEIIKSKWTFCNAIEVRGIFDGMEGIHTLSLNILINMKVDMVLKT